MSEATFDIIYDKINPHALRPDILLKEQSEEIWIELISDYGVSYYSNSGSEYIYTSEGVYRYSNHWGDSIASCSWRLNINPNLKRILEDGMADVSKNYKKVFGITKSRFAPAFYSNHYRRNIQFRFPVIGFCPWGEFTEKI